MVVADKVRNLLQRVAGVARGIKILIGEISSATSEQTNGIGQVGEAVTQLGQVTQLAEVVSVFRLAS